MPPLTSEEILDNLNTNAIATVAELTTAINTAIAAMNALRDKAAVQTDKVDEVFAAIPADVTLPSGDIVPNFAKVRYDLQTAITAFTSVAYLEATDQAVDSAKLEGKTLLEISTEIKSAIIDGAPAIYDTLLEISNALTDDDTVINGLLTQLGSLSTSLTDLAVVVADKAPTVHEHDSRYYTKSQTDTAIGNATSKPTFTTDAVTNIVGTAATLNGTISDFVDASSSLQYRFIYGPTTTMEEGATTWTTASAIGAVSAGITVALLTTTYYALMQVRDTNKPDSMGLLPVPADWAAERTSFLSGSEVLDADSYIYLQGTGGTGVSSPLFRATSNLVF